MSERTGISWCDSTFNPWIGCTKISPGCDHCYAERDMSKRLKVVSWGAGQPRKRTSAANWKLPERWDRELFCQCPACGWRGEERQCAWECEQCPHCGSIVDLARRRVFCASLGDWLDNEVPIEWLADLLALIRSTPHLDWLLLTKRLGNWRRRLEEAAEHLRANRPPDAGGDAHDRTEGMVNAWLAGTPPDNVWLGVTVVNQEEADRDVPKLLEVPARVRFLSIEPMLAPVDLSRWLAIAGNPPQRIPRMHNKPLHWVIAGGESGPNARPMHPDWVRSLRDQCQVAGVPFHFKQHGEWLATAFCDDDMAMLPTKRTVYIRPDGSYHDGSDGIDFFGGNEAETAWTGKKAAGRQLDGRTWDGFPSEALR